VLVKLAKPTRFLWTAQGVRASVGLRQLIHHPAIQGSSSANTQTTAKTSGHCVPNEFQCEHPAMDLLVKPQIGNCAQCGSSYLFTLSPWRRCHGALADQQCPATIDLTLHTFFLYHPRRTQLGAT
jgi:hypothetical protein